MWVRAAAAAPVGGRRESWKRQQRQAERTDKPRGETRGGGQTRVLDKDIEEEWVRGVVGDMWVEWSVVVRGVGGSAIRPVLE